MKQFHGLRLSYLITKRNYQIMKISTIFFSSLLFLFCNCKRHQEYAYSDKEYAETEKALVGANRIDSKKGQGKYHSL